MNAKNFLSLCIVLTSLAVPARAQKSAADDSGLLNLRLEARGDYQREYVDGTAVKSNSGFKGRYLNIVVDGSLSSHFSYAYRQRLNRISQSSSFFDATDWLYLTYAPNCSWKFTAGKQIVAIGGFEYDLAPINVHNPSEYWNNIPCYQWGVSAGLTTRSGHDAFTAQVVQSPFNNRAPGLDMYAYNLYWHGEHGFFSTLWSVNMLEYQPGKFINYIALGNTFRLGRRVSLYADFVNRAASHQQFLLRDCSVVGEVSYFPSDRMRFFAKASYDVNRTHTDADCVVVSGTELTRVGGGLEYFPLPDKSVRLHAGASYAWGTNSNPAGTLQDKQTFVDAGVTWRMNLLKLKK